MATQTEVLQAGVNADNYLVGPSVLLIQAAANFSTADPGDGTGMPRYIEDVINVADGSAVSGNGWEYIGYTENVALSRTRTVVQHDSDQEARVKTVHDVWENMVTVTALESTLARLQDFLAGETTGAVAVPATANNVAQQYQSFGNTTEITDRRLAIIHISDIGEAWMWCYRKTDIRPTGGPTFTRSGRVEWPLEATCKPDTDITDVDDRVFRLYKTDGVFA